MTLDAPRSDADLLRLHAERTGHTAPQRVQEPVRPTITYRAAPSAGRMNKTEARYAEALTRRVHAGELVSWHYEAISLRLATRTWYRPDFLVVTPTGLEIHEVKGHWEDDARVKFKVAAEQFSMFVFRAVRWRHGQWEIETLSGACP